MPDSRFEDSVSVSNISRIWHPSGVRDFFYYVFPVVSLAEPRSTTG